MSDERADKRLERIRADLEVFPGEVGGGDVAWLLQRHDELKKMLTAQQGAVDDAARNWRKIGYESGYSTGYDDCYRANIMPIPREIEE